MINAKEPLPSHELIDWIDFNGFYTWNEAGKTFWIDDEGLIHSMYTGLPDQGESYR